MIIHFWGDPNQSEAKRIDLSKKSTQSIIIKQTPCNIFRIIILVNVIFDIFPFYFSTDSDDQSWFDYIWSGKFSSQQTNLEKDNAHILLAETLIYSIPQPPKSSVKVDHSYPAPESDIKVNLSLISIFCLKIHSQVIWIPVLK